MRKGVPQGPIQNASPQPTGSSTSQHGPRLQVRGKTKALQTSSAALTNLLPGMPTSRFFCLKKSLSATLPRSWSP
eukprot:9034154-Pyramimonas_sp.AAC.1